MPIQAGLAKTRNRRMILTVVMTSISTVAVAESVPDMKIHFIDVGQGGATLFEFPCAAMLVDTGGELNRKVDSRKALNSYLDEFFAARPDLNRTLALLAITHPHADHTLGIRNVLESYEVDHVMTNGRRRGSGWELERGRGGQKLLDDHPSHETVIFDRVSDVTVQGGQGIDPIDCRSSDSPVDVNPLIQVLWGQIGEKPSGWDWEDDFQNGNNHSLVIRVQYGKAKVILTGDLETAAIKELLQRYQGSNLLDIDVYQVGHHGSYNGTTEPLLDRMSPRLAVISMGPSSRKCPWWWRECWTAWAFGHPRKSLVESLENAVQLDRQASFSAQVATAVKSFDPMTIKKCVYATGWGGTVVVSARASDGWIQVDRPAEAPCGTPPTDPIPVDAPAAELALLAARSGQVETAAIESRLLAARPLCEASAMLVAPWDDDVILIADNEVDEQLYAFSLKNGRLVPEMTLAMPEPGKERPRDLEALARVGSSVLAVGSHSRNSRCEPKSNRQRMRLLERRSDGSLKAARNIDSEDAWATAIVDEAQCLGTLFGPQPPERAEAACEAFLEAEESVAAGSSCKVFNIEGAFGTGSGRAWVGLRAPLLNGKAVLVRLSEGLDELRFDRVTLLDLEGRGIRELTVDGGTLYGIAGPVEDSNEGFWLFSVDLEESTAGGSLRPAILSRDLPTSSEGMAIVGGGALVAIDGGQGDDFECDTPSRQYRIDIP